MRELGALALATAFVMVIGTCGFAWGVATTETDRFTCQASPNPNALMVMLPPDLDEVR